MIINFWSLFVIVEFPQIYHVFIETPDKDDSFFPRTVMYKDEFRKKFLLCEINLLVFHFQIMLKNVFVLS